MTQRRTSTAGSHGCNCNVVSPRRSGALLLRLALVLSLAVLNPLSGLAAGAAGTPTTMTPLPSSNVAEQYLLDSANRSRAAHGLSPLRLDPTLAQAARFHALQMAEHRDISHQFPGEPDLMQRGAQAGVHFALITENVAESPDASIVHDLWMRSAGHRENLLDPEVNSIGIAVVSRGNRVYAVEDFAATVESLSFDQQEQVVSEILARAGITVGSSKVTSTTEEARRTCGMESGYSGTQNKPWYIVRYTADHPRSDAQHPYSSYRHRAIPQGCRRCLHGPRRRCLQRLQHCGIALSLELFRKELADIGECLELKCIARRVQKEHRRLFANLPLEADIGFNDEGNASSLQPLG